MIRTRLTLQPSRCTYFQLGLRVVLRCAAQRTYKQKYSAVRVVLEYRQRLESFNRTATYVLGIESVTSAETPMRARSLILWRRIFALFALKVMGCLPFSSILPCRSVDLPLGSSHPRTGTTRERRPYPSSPWLSPIGLSRAPRYRISRNRWGLETSPALHT